MAFGRNRDSLKTKPKENTENIIYIDPSGLSAEEAARNTEKYGKNILTKKKRVGFFRQLLGNLNDPIIKILLGALAINAVVSLGHINIPETIGIAAAITIATLVSTISEYSSSLAFEKLSNETKSSVYCVRRGGEIINVTADLLTVGDIVLLSPGQKIPADGYILSGEITCNQAPLTGESREVRKLPKYITSVPSEFSADTADRAKLFNGSIICTGNCEMVIIKIGDDTLIGRLAQDLQDQNRPSPLKKRLSDLAKSISYLGYVGAVMIAFAYLFNVFFIESGMDMATVTAKLSDKGYLISEILHAVTVAVSVIVVAVPEGLPMMITVVLSSNMKKMLRSGVLVRRLVGIETAGNLNILFTDKTGTLTTGNMTVASAYIYGHEFADIKELRKNKLLHGIIRLGTDAACGTGTVSATERAVISCFLSSGKRNSAQRTPFNSDAKYSEGIIDGTRYVMGAPEKLISASRYALSDNGSLLPITERDRDLIYEEMLDFAKGGARILALARGHDELCFICLLIIKDPLRQGIKDAVSLAHEAGIQVMMVTGDNPETAAAIAKEAGIICDGCDKVLTSDTLKRLTDRELKEMLGRVAVVSRALPEDKIRLVKTAEETGLVCGMTGDGVNDAPALKAADVGFAMGSGTDIAKESADIVITDDSFRSITNAILYGRTVFESIRKFIIFQLTMNLCAMGVSLIGPFIGIESPVTVIQMLWVNIIMDTLGGLAFAGEPALQSYMKKKSRPLSEKIVNRKMVLQILITGGYSLALCLFFLKSTFIRSLFEGKSENYFLTAFFALLIFCGIFNSFNARTPSPNILSHIAGNKAFIFIMGAVAVIQLMIIYFGGEIFRCIPLEKGTLLITALIALSVIPADMLRKFIMK